MFNALMLAHSRRPARRLVAIVATATMCLIGRAATLPACGQGLGEEARAGQHFGQGNGQQAGAGRQPGEVTTIADDPIDPMLPIKSSFTVNVNVERETEPSGLYVVDAAGTILLRIAEQNVPVSIKDQTAPQAAATLATFLKKYLHDPKVMVSLISVPRPVVSISGCVLVNGPVQINRHTHLVDVLARSGFSDNSDLTQVRLTRTQTVNGVEKTQEIILHPDSYMRPEPGKPLDVTQNPLLQDNDVIVVPFKTLSGTGGISITGEVLHPTESMLPRPGLTLREAISIVGGTTPTANKKTVSVKHGSLPEIIVDLNKAQQGDPANDVVLQPGDSVHVEPLPLSQVIRVEGGVPHAGPIPFEAGMTASKAIMNAGGASPSAKLKDCIVIRWPAAGDSGLTKIIKFNLDAFQKGHGKDLELQPADAIYLPPGNPPANGQQMAQMLQSLGLLLTRVPL